MIEIRMHGRGGQGAVVASEMLARAAVKDGMHASAFPFFGVERRGCPVTAYCRIDDKPIRIHAGIYEPDYVIVLDPSLMSLVDVFQGLKPDGKILINTTRTREELKIKPPNKMVTVDATGIALKRGLGSETAPIVNTAIIGAFVKMFPKISIGSLLESVKAAAPAKKEDNAAAAKDAYEITEEV
ncbi:MAG: 2-oxoacid:acceptor oxidoreductase family protein [Methanomassiliicoccales archaeon]|jgi:2-oxoacid:acceptor oxidoreductase gamma subunit (pyruvate/2-ketoisovalerate family)